MADPDLDTARSLEDPALAKMFRDQLQILGQADPEQLVTLVGDAMVFCLVTWSVPPRVDAIEAAQMRLCEIVAAHLGRRVASFGASTTEDRRRALVSFVLGEPTEARGELGEAVIAWARQTRRGARANRAEARSRRLEARTLRARSRAGRALV